MGKHSAGDGESGQVSQPSSLLGKPRRTRVVLADSRAPVTVLRKVTELEEQTSYGEELVRSFIGVQFRTSVRFGIVALVVLFGLPALFFTVPWLSNTSFVGVKLPWILLGVLPFPLLFGIGYWYNVIAERQERDFVDSVEK